MKVRLVNYTKDGLSLAYIAAKLCTSKNVVETSTPEKMEKLVTACIKSGHESIVEHISFSFVVSDVSRACTHQLVRHRLASFSQQSQRYVDLENFLVVLPKSISSNSKTKQIFDNLMNSLRLAYFALQQEGVPAEDARYILPNATTSNIMVTMNARELIHFCALRLCKRAQWEIRDLAEQMRDLVLKEYPWLPLMPKCELFGKCTESKPCNGK